MTAKSDVTVQIAKLNDDARSNADNYMMTRGINALNAEQVSEIFMQVQNFTDFNEDNDPYGEHDFGTIYHGNVFWKIDYYDESLSHWSDPLDPRTKRIITIMLREEY